MASDDAGGDIVVEGSVVVVPSRSLDRRTYSKHRALRGVVQSVSGDRACVLLVNGQLLDDVPCSVIRVCHHIVVRKVTRQTVESF